MISGDVLVFSGMLICNENQRKINIIESEPYNYRITFDDFYKYKTISKKYEQEDITFEIKSVYNNFQYISYNMQITNNSNTYVGLNLSTNKGVILTLTDGMEYTIINSVNSEPNTKLSKKGSINKNIIFNIPLQVQNKVEKITFMNVKIDGAELNITLVL